MYVQTVVVEIRDTHIYTTTDSAFCPGSKLAFVPVLEPGQGFRDKSLSRLLSRVEEPGQKVPDVKNFFCSLRDSIPRLLAQRMVSLPIHLSSTRDSI